MAKRNKFKYDVYLAGAMHGRRVCDVLTERQVAKDYCDYYKLSYYDPAGDEGLEKLNPESLITSCPTVEVMRHYVAKDDANLDRCRVLLVLTGDINSSGTAWEMARQYYKNKRPIFLVSKLHLEGQIVNFTSIKAGNIHSSIPIAVVSIDHYLKGERQCPLYPKRDGF